MLSFMQNLFAPKGNPIGVDFGTDCLRLAQVQLVGGEWRLVAAASADVPSHIAAMPRSGWAGSSRPRATCWPRAVSGRQAVLALPAASMHIQHLRMPKMDEEAMKKALPWEVRGKLPIDPSQALLRHIVAGEIYQDQEPKNEVIVMAAHRELVNQFLAAASRARLDVVGMNVEPQALVDCFGHIYRRKTDADVTNCFVDIGCIGDAGGDRTRQRRSCLPAIHPHRRRPFQPRRWRRPCGSSFEDAKMLRMKLCSPEAVAG